MKACLLVRRVLPRQILPLVMMLSIIGIFVFHPFHAKIKVFPGINRDVRAILQVHRERLDNPFPRESTISYLEPTSNTTKNKSFEYFLVVMTMIKNKAPFLPEWIEFHLMQGFDRFVIYDHGSTDNLLHILSPYLDMGIVEYIRWPDDVFKANQFPLGPRFWPNETTKSVFWDKKFLDECLHSNRHGWRPHGGCQRAAVFDSISRYRHRTRWLTTFDVDEFMGPINTSLSVRDNLLSLDEYDQVIAHGKSFGTNGFLSDPIPLSSGIPFPLLSERYTHRYSFNTSRDEELVRVVTHTFTQKAFARASKISESWIHFFVFDDYLSLPENKDETIKEYGTDRELNPPLFWMYHYRFFSLMGIYGKRVSNGNFDLKYERARESFFNEVEDNYMQEWSSVIKRRIQERLSQGYWRSLPLGASLKVSDKVASTFKSLQKMHRLKPLLCVGVTWFNASIPTLRRTIQSFVHHMRSVEPHLPYELHLHLGSEAFQDVLRNVSISKMNHDKLLLLTKLPDLAHQLTLFRIHSHFTRREELWEAAESSCQQSPYFLHLEDVWETRLDVGANFEFEEAPILKNVGFVQSSIELLESFPYIHEVWVGDVPSFPAYWNVQSEWKTIPHRSGHSRIKRPSHYRLQCPFDSPHQHHNHTLKRKYYEGLDLLAFSRPGAAIKRVIPKSHDTSVTWLNAIKSRAYTTEQHAFRSPILDSQVQYAHLMLAQDMLNCTAHFCRSESLDDCSIDVDNLRQESVFGFMWRQRLVFDHEAGDRKILYDRPT